MEVYLIQWLSLALKFLHVITGIAWIGASFYFNWLENKLERVSQSKDGIAGHLWAIHGGGFYYLEKYKKYPEQLPKTLHWFKWEAYFTWMSGILLLTTIYYFNASSYLLINDSSLTAIQGILLSLAGFVIAWLFYDSLCKSPLAEKTLIMLFLIVIFIAVSSYFYHQFFNPRAAFMQVGGMIGTIMVANVFFVIIPVQKLLVKACENKTAVSAELGVKGYIRSRHNNYFTLPVLFIMISGHYPIVYSSTYSWLILIVCLIICALIRHVFNLRAVGQKTIWFIVSSIILIVSLMMVLSPTISKTAELVSLTRVQQIIDKRCVSCHSTEPTDSIFTIAPNGFVLNTKQDILKAKDQIYAQSVISQAMPFLNNKTKMTLQERKELGVWFNQQK